MALMGDSLTPDEYTRKKLAAAERKIKDLEASASASGSDKDMQVLRHQRE